MVIEDEQGRYFRAIALMNSGLAEGFLLLTLHADAINC